MAHKTVFLSHIHEEKEFALLIKTTLEEEFGGFVKVFVSSDGTSIPAGSNFLKRIETSLLTCDAAVYLISQFSVKRNWINFELGAIWIRSLMNAENDGPEIPLLPICHSGAKPGSLPAPLNNLNAISGTESSQLEFAFKSIQSAIGGSGRLRTDFDDLASKLLKLQIEYTETSNFAKVLKLVSPVEKLRELVENLERNRPEKSIILQISDIQKKKAAEARDITHNLLKNVRITSLGVKTAYGPNGADSYESLEIEFSIELFEQTKHLL
ncbi:toll/interleukin-1 receptor domain-containing protein [Pseudomonas monteilii]|uniref:toll/interleukin-1 receptor domain-containing protein n=1 Tax=Pseudomonas monteilii TaxID=76759 RepID=UPI003906D42E